MNKFFSDKGSGAKHDIQIWIPNVSKNPGYYSLGDVGVDNYDDSPPNIFLIKGIDGDLAKPTGYSRVWKDTGSGAKDDFSFWKPTAPNGYKCLGHVGQKGYDEPSTDRIRCVKENYVRSGQASWLWNDKKSGAKKDVSLYESLSKDDDKLGISLNLFLSQDNYRDAEGEYLVLDRSRIKEGLFGRYETVNENTAKTLAPNVYLHSNEEYFPGKIDVFLSNV